MIELQRGARNSLDKYLNLNDVITIEMNINGSATYDFACFGLDASDKLNDDRYMIFYNQISSPQGEITYNGDNSSATFNVNIGKLPTTINKLVFTVNIDGNGRMKEINSHSFSIRQGENTAMSLNLSGNDFAQETAIITAELYRKDNTWRINAVARGFDGGLSVLLKNFGGEEILTPQIPEVTNKFSPSSVTTCQPQIVSTSESQGSAPQPTDLIPQKVCLQKGQSFNLIVDKSGTAEIVINLNWTRKKGLFANNVDLDLCSLYELQNGAKSSVQAVGRHFGSLTQPPYVALDADDRTGTRIEGENLHINGKMISQIKRLLIFTYIYDGVPNWKSTDAVATVKCPGSPDIVVNLNENGGKNKLCAIALLENVGDTFNVKRIVQYFPCHKDMDDAFNWGLNWSHGTK